MLRGVPLRMSYFPISSRRPVLPRHLIVACPRPYAYFTSYSTAKLLMFHALPIDVVSYNRTQSRWQHTAKKVLL